MKKIGFVFVILTLQLNAFFSADFSTGYRNDYLTWNIAAPGGHPDVLSELTWKNLTMVNYSAELRGSFLRCFYWKLSADYGKIFSGTVQDSDYAGDHKSNEFSRTISSANKGEAFDLSMNIGRKCYNILHVFSFIPTIGVEWHAQHLRMRGGEVIIGDISDLIGLHSNYRANWIGTSAGIDFQLCRLCGMSLDGSVNYVTNYYYGTGHWNLRDDFLDDFKHYGWGGGYNIKLKAAYSLVPCMSIGIKGEYQEHWVNNGRDSIKAIINGDIAHINQHLNGVRWRSARIMGVVSFGW